MKKIRHLLLLGIILIFMSSCRYQYHEAVELPLEKSYINKKPNLALVLSGAGGKAIMHAGVIAAFEKNKIPIDLIVGSSAGALVGTLYAEHKNADYVKNALINASRADFLQGFPASYAISAPFNGSAHFARFLGFLKKHIKSRNFEDLNIPVVAVATDIKYNKIRIYNSGAIYPAVIASCAIPGLYKPVKIGDAVLTDGAIIAPVPVKQALKFHPKIVVAVNLMAPPAISDIRNNFSMLYKSSWITQYQLAQMELGLADISLNIDTSKYDWLHDFSKEEKLELFQIGFDAAEDLIKKNRKLLSLRNA